MVNKISKRRNKSKKSINGGKPILRNNSEIRNSSQTTIRRVFENIQNVTLVSDPLSSFYGYFFKIDFTPTQLYLDINTSTGPRPSNCLGYKIAIITNPGDIRFEWPGGGGAQKGTNSIDEFRNEITTQYTVFSNSCSAGANSLTPGIVHTHILSNDQTIAHLNRLLRKSGARGTPANTCLTKLITVFTRENRWRLGGIFMELVRDCNTIYDKIKEDRTNLQRKMYLNNLMRWALLRSAMVSGWFHADFHHGNALYSAREGFFRLYNAAGNYKNINESVQLIDWGRSFDDFALSDQFRNFFTEIRNYIRTYPNFYNEQNETMPYFQQLKIRIQDLFNQWIQRGLARGFRLQRLSWVSNINGEERINAFQILYCEQCYLLNRLKLHQTPNLLDNAIIAPDVGIVNSILRI